MGGARDVGWVAAGLVLAAGACYCFYKLTRGRRLGGRRLRLRPSRSAAQVQKVDLPLNWMSVGMENCCNFLAQVWWHSGGLMGLQRLNSHPF
ncbi:hypothetical protein FD754_022622 [Muntiacus muntjak]|uniref:Armadillo repeat-containing domain-containing protein n=1 Tax=Muntiacus muntjak TaxID=9888 RepID=A0A5N3V941_MUNMU|nr:hypothetical protein FD754_022622 [Muntiacus muntjak]